MPTVYYNVAKINELDDFTLPQFFEHESKNQSHFLARLCLARLINHKMKANLTPLTLEVQNYCDIKNFPQLKCSLTHTKNLAAAVLVEQRIILSVGIDIELKSREISKDSERFYINQEDHFFDIPLLLKWCIKESCFKALANAKKEIKLLKDVVIDKNSFGLTKDEAKSGRNQFKIVETENLYIAIAYCAKQEVETKIKNINP